MVRAKRKELMATKTRSSKQKSHCTIRNSNLFCTHCGGVQAIPYPIAPDIFSAMAKAFEKMHKDCEPAWKQPEVNPSMSEKEKAYFWMRYGERGLSSETMFDHLCPPEFGFPKYGSRSHPHDPDDFRRCHGLLLTVPEWRGRMDAMRSVSPVWSKLVDNWDKLTVMLEEALNDKKRRKSSKMYEFMQSLGC